MKKLSFYCLLLSMCCAASFPSCKKSSNGTPYVPVVAGLQANFGYKPGSYWIYRDSITGEIDSAYVTYNFYDTGQLGCVGVQGAPEFVGMMIFIQVAKSNPADSEAWHITLLDSSFSISFVNNRDVVQSLLHFTLFNYPINVGNCPYLSSCTGASDNGAITDIIPEVSLNSQNYSNAAKSAHVSTNASSSLHDYNDCFYVNQSAGIMKAVFIHPYDSVHRVLELQRYNIVR